MKGIRSNYEHTIFASYIGYITQAIVNNFVPLLFLTFQSTYGISLDKITLLVSLNFGVQLLVDFFAARFVDRIGYRPCVVAAHIFSAAGLAGLSFLPDAMADPYAGIVISIICYAIGGGLIEVLISPIVEACPTEHKDAVMSLLHSFYCWGHVFVVLASTLFFTFVGIDHWRTMALLWAVIPLFNCFYFLLVPIKVLVEDGKGMSVKELFQNRMFWLLFVLMLCAGASEQGMSQWASAFAEMGLGVSKTIGDLAGPCAFAVCMGASRVFYGKFGEHIRLGKVYAVKLCAVHYQLFNGVLFTGAFFKPCRLRPVRPFGRHYVAGMLLYRGPEHPPGRHGHVCLFCPGRRYGLRRRSRSGRHGYGSCRRKLEAGHPFCHYIPGDPLHRNACI